MYFRSKLYDIQNENSKYYIHIGDTFISTNSVAVLAELRMRDLIYDIDFNHETNHNHGRLRAPVIKQSVEAASNDGMRNQVRLDDKKLFICQVTTELPAQDKIEETKLAAERCHEDESAEYAWDDVNKCQLDPMKVKAAWAVEMEYFRKMKVYRKVPIQTC